MLVLLSDFLGNRHAVGGGISRYVGYQWWLANPSITVTDMTSPGPDPYASPELMRVMNNNLCKYPKVRAALALPTLAWRAVRSPAEAIDKMARLRAVLGAVDVNDGHFTPRTIAERKRLAQHAAYIRSLVGRHPTCEVICLDPTGSDVSQGQWVAAAACWNEIQVSQALAIM